MLTELVDLPGGSFRMGSTSFYPEEAPIHTVTVPAFAVERHPVTNAQFAEFVFRHRLCDCRRATDRSGALPGGGSERPVSGRHGLPPDAQARSTCVTGGNGGTGCRAPTGDSRSGPTAISRAEPITRCVQVAYPDAAAYARWAGRRLPTEAEWEYAARGGTMTTYSWGDEPNPDGRLMANTWQGRFPYRNDGALGWVGTSPVGTFPPNGFGLLDMIGNVWEWTATEFSAHHRLDQPPKACCAPSGPADPSVSQTLKGGSHLCAPEYCHRYRPAARSPQSQDTATTHIGFRCVANSQSG